MALEADRDVVAARIVKGRLERTTLGQVAKDISLQFKPSRLLACFCNVLIASSKRSYQA